MPGRHRGVPLALLIGLAMSPCLFAGKEFLAGPGEQVAPNQLVVGLRAGADINQIVAALVPQALASPAGSHLNTYLLQLPPGIQAAASKLLAAHPLVNFVEPNHILHTTVLPPNDSLLTSQWDLTTVQAVQAWSYLPDRYLTAATAGTSRVMVALIDTGVDCTHPDFMNAGGTSTNSALGGQLSWTLSQALVVTTISSPCQPWQDDIGHGTHTGGTIAAATNNATGVASTGFPLQLIVYKVFDTSGKATDSIIATAIDDAVNAGAQVISMSLGGPGYSQALQQAMDYAWEHNVLVVAAAGNSGDNSLQYPGGGNHVLGVSATDSSNALASFSTYGNWIKIAAPGVNILSTLPTYVTPIGGTNYGYLSGTSMATPHVAAAGGLLYMLYPNLSVAEIAQRLQQTAQTPFTGWDQHIGYGVVNAGAALGGASPTATQGSLVGQVTDPFGNPITGAVVTAGSLSFTTAVDPNTGNDDGLFRLANLNPGTYSVMVTATGYSAVNMQAVVVAGADTMLTIPMGVSLGEFTGVVTHNGLGVPGAAVAATSGGLIQGTAVTGASGAYAVYLGAGTYTLTASAPNYIDTTSGSKVLTGGGTVTVNLALPALGNLIGTVTDANGLGVAGAHIDFTSTGFSGGAGSGANGSYSTFGIPAGTYTVTASASGYNNVSLSGVGVTANTSTLANFQFSTGVSLTSGLLGYWPFDEDSGAVAHDLSGNGYNAALSNTTWTAGKFNSGLSFNGSDSGAITSAIPFTSTFSVSTWANPAVTPQTAFARIAETEDAGGMSLGLDTTGAKYKFIVNAGTGSTGTCGSAYGCAEGATVTGGWHLVTGTYDGATAILYVDGAMVAADTATAPASVSLPLSMGKASGSGSLWNGVLDDMRLYSRALTGAEVSSLFSQGGAPNLGLTKTADAATVAAGAAIGYTLAVSNSGGIATSATLSDSLPAGTGVSWSISPAYSGPGTCSIVSQTLTCSFGNLTSGGTATVHVTSATSASSCAAYANTATVSASNSGAVPASATTTVQCPSLGLTKTADAATVAAGAAIGYTLAVSNTGAGTATSATLSDSLPAGTGVSWSISPAYSGPGTCSIVSQTLTCNFGNLAAGGTATVHVTSATSASSCAAYANTATVSASNSSAVPASATTTVQCPSLGLTKTADAATVAAGAAIGYTLAVSNTGAGTATSATLSDSLPAGTGVSWSISPAYSGPGTCSIVSQTLTCNFGNLAAGGTATVHVTSATSASSCAAYANTATVSASNSSAVPASATTTVQCPSLSLTKTADAATVAAGAAIGYTLAVSNTGAGTATSATLSDSLPAGTGVSWSISPAYSGPGTCSIVSQTLTCNFGNLAAGGTATVHVTSATSASSCAAYANTATVSASNSSAVPASATTTVQCPVLTIRKTHTGNFTQGQPGVAYTVTVGNSPIVPTSGAVSVTETLPAGLTLVSMAGTGWTCPGGGTVCMRSDPLGGGAFYPAITVTVNVNANAPSLVTNQVMVSGGGSASAGASDPTSVSPFTCAISGDGVTSVVDVQMIINEALGAIPGVHDLNHDGVVNVADVQKVINAALGLGCPY
jgi:uncharacterized repeat protein (TIGR01451 family)